jgi:hypothetical protein
MKHLIMKRSPGACYFLPLISKESLSKRPQSTAEIPRRVVSCIFKDLQDVANTEVIRNRGGWDFLTKYLVRNLERVYTDILAR